MIDYQTPSENFILFELAGTTYGLHSQVVQQMEIIERITPVPNAPYFVEGVVFSRGQMIPVINLRLRFGFEKIPYDARSRLIVIRALNRTVGLIVDTAREFISIQSNALLPPPEGISGLSGKYLEAIALSNNRIVLILNVDELLSSTDAISAVSVETSQAQDFLDTQITEQSRTRPN